MNITSLKEHVDLLALLSGHTQLRKKASTDGGEFAGPCPFCGGQDRFRVWPARGRWWCRQCERKGDAITLVQELNAVDFRTACNWLQGNQRATVPAQAAPKYKRPDKLEHGYPLWEDAALHIVSECEETLWSVGGAKARAWLHQRGLEDETLREWRVGYAPVGGNIRGVWLPAGIVVPGIAVDGHLWYLKIRRAAGEPKYLNAKPLDSAIPGAHPALIGRLSGKPVLLLAEGEFDAMLAWQEVGGLVDVATLGSSGADPKPWIHHLLPYLRLLVAYDVDREGEDKAYKRWGWTARAVRAYLPLTPNGNRGSKDITDFVRDGGDLRAWVRYYLACSGVLASADDQLLAQLEAGALLLQQREAVGDRGVGFQRLFDEWGRLLQRYEGRERREGLARNG